MGLPRAALLAALLAIAPLARADEDPAPAPAPAAPAAPAVDEAKARKDAKVRRFLLAARWKETILAGLDASFGAAVKAGQLPKAYPKKFREMADFEELENLAVEMWSAAMDEETLDAAIAYHESEAGKKYTAASMGITSRQNEVLVPWFLEQRARVMNAILEAPPEAGEGAGDKVLEGIRASRRSANEAVAVALLRNIASAQSQLQGQASIDADGDRTGEFGTFLEMTASTGVRKDATAAARGPKLDPPLLARALAGVDDQGVVRKNGYCFRIFLPDASTPARFAYETGPAEKAAMAGTIGTDLAETAWCAYAWPERNGDTGKRVFFVNQAGDVMQSANAVGKWSGDNRPPGDAALLGAGFTARPAVGTTGRDGDVWKVVN